MKTQKEFLEALEEELRFLKGQEINEILKHYRDKIGTEIDYGTLEEKVIKNLPEPKDIAKEIYKSRGISYLEIQKKKYRQKEITKAVISGIVIALMTILFVVLTIYVGYTSTSILSLLGHIFTFRSVLDIIITLLIVILLELSIVVLYLFLIDLFYIIISSFLVNILKAIKKAYKPHYKFQDFTINGFLKSKVRGKNILLILLISFIGSVILLSGVSVVSNGYVYRSMSKSPSIENAEVQEFDHKVKDIIIKGDSANIEFNIDNTISGVKVEYREEFKKDILLDYSNNTLTISNLSIKTFGLFGFLDEPTPVVIISIPDTRYLKNINITLNDGNVYLKQIKAVGLSVNLEIYESEIYLENTELKSLTLDKCYKTTTKIANLPNEDGSYDTEYSWISNLNINVDTGNVYLERVKCNSYKFNSITAGSVIKDSNLDDANIKTSGGNIQLINLIGNSFVYETNSSNNNITDLNYQNVKVTANMASKVTLTRIVTTNKLELFAYTNGTVHASNVKAKSLDIVNNNSNIGLKLLNMNVDTSQMEKVDALVEKYNKTTIANTTLNIESTGVTSIMGSTIHNANVKQTGKTLQVSDCDITDKAVFENDSVEYLKFSKVYGTNIHFVLKESELNYYNDEPSDETKAKFYYRYVGASLAVSTDVAKEVEEGVTNE